MALRIRRGTDADRLTITPESGEPIYTTDTKELYVGDGSTEGGILVGPVTSIANIVEDTTPQLGGNLDLNGNNIIGSGNINITGTITATGNINLGDGVEDNVIVGGQIGSNLTPTSDSAFNLGSSSKRWGNVYAHSVVVDGQLDAANIKANLIADDSAVAFNSSTGQFNGVFDGELTGSVFADDSTTLVDSIAQVINAPGGFVGNLTGTVNGELSGSVFADNSTLLVDGVNATLNLAVNSITDLGNVSIDVANVADIPDGSVLAFNGITKQFENAPLYLGGTNFDIVKGNFDGSFSGDVLGDDSTLLIDGFNKNASFVNLDVSTTLTGLTINASLFECSNKSGSIIGGSIISREVSGTKAGIFKLQRVVDGTIADTGPHGQIIWEYNDDSTANTDLATATLSAGKDNIRFRAYSVGVQNRTDESGSLMWKAGQLGVGTETPTSTLDVRGDAVADSFTGDLKGSLFIDDSTRVLDATDGSFYIANIDVIGQTGNSPADTGSVDSWLELSVNGATKYIPLYD